MSLGDWAVENERDCKHGRLKRSCETCEWEARADAAEQRADALAARVEALQTWYGDHEEREAACCPEDTRCTDYIGLLLDTLKMIDATTAALRAERDALAARVEALHNHLGELCEVAHLRGDDNLPHPADDPRMWTARMQTAWDEANTLLDSTPAADLAAHDARIRREALEAAAKKCAEAYWAMVAPRDHAAMHPTIEFWRDALGLEPLSPAEHEALAAIEPRHPEIVMVDDLAMLVRLLVHSIRKHSPDNETARKAMDYLRRHELQGSPLRTTILSPAPDAAKPNNQQEQP